METTEHMHARKLAEAQHDANTDYLTGLLNRRGLDHARMYNPKGGTYVVIDLDGFKEAQDNVYHGHDWGDKVLQRIAAYLRRNTRQANNPGNPRTPDLVAARTGGDEFVVWCSSKEGAERIADKVREWEHEGITASVGIGDSLTEADEHMYHAKRVKRRKSKGWRPKGDGGVYFLLGLGLSAILFNAFA